MRISIKMSSRKAIDYNKFNKYYIQSAIYSYLVGTKYENLHNYKSFKFFTFSDIFPSGDLNPGEEKNLIISSPDEEFIRTLYENISSRGLFYLYDEVLEINSVKVFNLNLHKIVFESGSPVVLYKESDNNRYFSFRRGDTLNFFLDRLKDNAIKKMRSFYGVEFDYDELLFDTLSFHKEVSIPLKKSNSNFIIIGTTWYKLEKTKLSREAKKFYSFIMEAGLGEKNSMGFGFVNPKREVLANV